MTATLTQTRSGKKTPKSRGPLVIRWIEACCVLGEGDSYGEKFILRPWQKDFINKLYSLKPDGTRQYRRALFGLPKGNGKSQIAAAIAAYELFGPDRKSPVVAIGAASYKQADLVFGALKACVRKSPILKDEASVFNLEIQLRNRPGRAFRVAAVEGTNDGQLPTVFIADELHEWRTPAQEGAFRVMSFGLSKRRDSLQLSITTAGSDLDSLLGELYAYGKKVEAGEIQDDEFLFVWYEAPDIYDLEDPDQLRQAIRAANPAADDFRSVEDVAAVYLQRQQPEYQFRRYMLNQWTHADECWLPAGAWQGCLGEVTFDSERPTFVGIDAAATDDTSAVVVAQDDGEGVFNVAARIFDPADSGGRTDIFAIEAYLRELQDAYNVKEFVYDPRYFLRSAEALEQDGLTMVQFDQSLTRLVPACGKALELILNRQVRHDGDPLLTEHVLSAQQRYTRDGTGWTLYKSSRSKKIDACMAMVFALWRATELVQKPVRREIGFWNYETGSYEYV